MASERAWLYLSFRRGGEFGLVEFFYSYFDVLGQDEFQEGLLAVVELGSYGLFGLGGSLLSRSWGHGVGYVGQDVE